MANIADLVGRFKTLVDAQAGIKTAVFDDLSALNQDRAKQYPVALMTPPDSEVTELLSSTRQIERYTVDIWVYDEYYQAEQKTTSLEAKWAEVKGELLTLIKSMHSPTNYMIDPATVLVTVDRFAANDRLIFAKGTFTIILQECYGE